ncbi:hypothetical protein ACRYGX_14580 [Mycobacteroides abscessus]
MPQLICHAAELPLRRVSAEVPRRASRRLRIAGALLYATARQFLELAVWIDKHHLVPIRALVFVCRFATHSSTLCVRVAVPNCDP